MRKASRKQRKERKNRMRNVRGLQRPVLVLQRVSWRRDDRRSKDSSGTRSVVTVQSFHERVI